MLTEKSKISSSKGFTLIELLVVISIIGMLSSVFLVALHSARDKGRLGADTLFSSNLYHNFGANAAVIYDLDEGGSAITSKDLSSNNNYLQLVNSPSWTNGIRGNGLSFTALSNQYAIASGNVKNIIVQQGGSWTLATWVYQNTGFGGNRTFLALGMIPFLSFSSIGKFTLSWINDNVNNPGFSGNPAVYNPSWGMWELLDPSAKSLKKWYFVAATYSKNTKTITLFVDGKQVITQSNALANAPSTNYLYVGNYSNTDSYGCDCTLDEVRVYTESLATAQIEKLYAEGKDQHKNLAVNLPE
mgnify:FL=1